MFELSAITNCKNFQEKLNTYFSFKDHKLFEIPLNEYLYLRSVGQVLTSTALSVMSHKSTNQVREIIISILSDLQASTIDSLSPFMKGLHCTKRYLLNDIMRKRMSRNRLHFRAIRFKFCLLAYQSKKPADLLNSPTGLHNIAGWLTAVICVRQTGRFSAAHIFLLDIHLSPMLRPNNVNNRFKRRP